jgi:hypothetical protein
MRDYEVNSIRSGLHTSEWVFPLRFKHVEYLD